MKTRLALILLVALMLPFPAGAATTTSDDFVKTANYFLLSGRTLEDASTIDTLSRYDLLVLPVEAQAYNRAFFAEVRRRNPDIILLAYVPTVSWNDRNWHDPIHDALLSGIHDEWRLTDAAGNRKAIWPDTTALNLTSGWRVYLADFVVTQVLGSGLWDGVFYDEVGDSIDWVGNVDADRDGRDDAPADLNARWADAYRDLFQRTRAAVGNGAYVLTNGSSNRAFAPFVNGRMFETFPSAESPLNFWIAKTREYLSLEDAVAPPSIVIVNVNTANTGNRNDFRKVRFGIATTLLGDGFFSFDYGTQSHAQLWTFDEYGAFLGAPKSEPRNVETGAVGQVGAGVWEREFEQGKVVLNATGDSKLVPLGGEFEKLHGSQDPAMNDGSILTRLPLASQDAAILLRPIERVDEAMFRNGAFARVFGSDGAVKRTGFFAYDAAYRGGLRVERYDVDLDGELETIVADATYLTIYEPDGSVRAHFAPYTTRYALGINFAVGDIENDGSVEIVTGTEKGGGPQMRIFNKDGVLIHPGFFAYDPAFRGGVHITIGDLNGDHINEIIAGAGPGGGPHIRVFNKDGRVINPGFYAYSPSFRGGVFVAAGDVDGDGVDEIIAGAGPGGGPHIRVYDRDGNLKRQFFAFDASERKGVEVAASDVDGDGVDEIVGLSSDVFTLSSY